MKIDSLYAYTQYLYGGKYISNGYSESYYNNDDSGSSTTTTWFIEPNVNSWRKTGTAKYQNPYIDNFKSIMEISSSVSINARTCAYIYVQYDKGCTSWGTSIVGISVSISPKGVINITNNQSDTRNPLRVTNIKLYSSTTNTQLPTNDQVLLDKLSVLKTKNLENTKQKLSNYKSEKTKIEEQIN